MQKVLNEFKQLVNKIIILTVLCKLLFFLPPSFFFVFGNLNAIISILKIFLLNSWTFVFDKFIEQI